MVTQLDGIHIKGLNELRAELRKRPEKVLRAMGEALYVEGETIMTRSKQIVPVDIGTLKGSGIVQRAVLDSTPGATVTLGYGGEASAYAEIQHRRTDYKHRGQGQAHYLSEPVDAARKGFGERLLARTRRVLTQKVV